MRFNKLYRVPLLIGFMGLIGLIGLICFFRSTPVILGFVFGNVLAATHFIFLAKMVVKMMDANYTRKGLLAGLFFLKLLFVLGVLFIAFGVFHVSVVGFAVGYGALVVAIVGTQLLQ